jgi:hypothetical protein
MTSKIEKAIVKNLTDDLLTNAFRQLKERIGDLPNTFGHCYVASEAAFHLLGGKKSGWKPQFIRHLGCPHWFLKHRDGRVMDLTAEQFQTPIEYDRAIGKGFLTRKPSKRAKVLIKRVGK